LDNGIRGTSIYDILSDCEESIRPVKLQDRQNLRKRLLKEIDSLKQKRVLKVTEIVDNLMNEIDFENNINSTNSVFAVSP
jgi:hypothetical protein